MDRNKLIYYFKFAVKKRQKNVLKRILLNWIRKLVIRMVSSMWMIVAQIRNTTTCQRKADARFYFSILHSKAYIRFHHLICCNKKDINKLRRLTTVFIYDYRLFCDYLSRPQKSPAIEKKIKCVNKTCVYYNVVPSICENICWL